MEGRRYYRLERHVPPCPQFVQYAEPDILAMDDERRNRLAANARLIAAATDLLMACEWVDAIVNTAVDGGALWCSIRDRPGASEWANNLHAAIAKATEND